MFLWAHPSINYTSFNKQPLIPIHFSGLGENQLAMT